MPLQPDVAASTTPPSLRRRVLVGVSSVMMGRFVAMAAMFALNVLLARRVDFDDREMGAYLLATFLVPMIFQFSTMGTTEVLLRVVRTSAISSSPRTALLGFQACFKLLAVSGTFWSLVFVGLSWILSPGRPQWMELSQAAAWVIAWSMLVGVSQIVAELFRGRDRYFASTAIFSSSGGWATNLLILAAVGIEGARTADLSLHVVLAIHVAVIAVANLVALAMTLPSLRAEAAASRETEIAQSQSLGDIPARPSLRWILSEALPIFAWGGTLLSIDQLDFYVVSVVCDEASVADYGLAKKCVAITSIAFLTLGQSLMPFMAELYQRGELKRLERLVRGASTLVGLPCLAMTIVLFVGADLFAMIFGPERAGMAAPFRVLLAGQAFLFIAGHGSLVLLMVGRQRELMRSTLYLGAFYAALLPVAVYFWGMMGAAVAKSLATAERSAAAAVIVRKVLGIATMSAFSPAMVKDSIKVFRRKAPHEPDESVIADSLET